MPNAEPPRRLELLAPAGDLAALTAALEAGADAVYFGLTVLNARRRARNVRPEDLAAAVARLHQHQAQAYLTLNTDITDRELGQAARILALARQCRVDAVLVRDPALLLLRPLFPELAFHFSTQAGVANSADMAAARELGLNRVVLARELTLAEIRLASAVPGVQTEVFVQGALCYCVSGRCLLSSWGGGRSGNRGLCASPCRVPWRVGESAPGQLLSMRDVSAVCGEERGQAFCGGHQCPAAGAPLEGSPGEKRPG
jgi:putative protease